MPHSTIAASEQTLIRIFNAFRDRFVFEKADTKSFGRFTAGYDIKAHLERGTLDLRSDNTVQIKELDIKWDRLNLSLGFDIPRICVGGFCIIGIPFDGCLVEAPSVCVFEGDPDINVTLPLGGFTTELSVTGSFVTKPYENPNRPSGMDDWAAREHVPPLNDKWQLFIDPQFVDIDLIDVSETVGDLLEAAVRAVIDGLLGWLPDVLKDIIWGIIGPVIDLIKRILDIPDDIQEWISDLLNISFGIIDIIGQFIADYFAAKKPLFECENPYPMLPEGANPNNPAGPPLVPVLIPIAALDVFNTDKELVLQGTIG